MNILKENAGLGSNNNVNSDFTINFDFSIFQGLMECEVFDHPQLLEAFIKNMIDNQSTLIMTLDEIEEKYCNGNFNSNPLLKMMLIQFAFGYSIDQQILKRGWVKDKDVYSRGNRNFATALHHIYSSKEDRGNKIHRIEATWPHYLGQSTIKFFIDNNLEFRMHGPFYFIWFLKRLEYIEGLPKGLSIDKIIKFDLKENENYEWNKDIFNKYLIEGIKNTYISQEEYNRFIKLLVE